MVEGDIERLKREINLRQFAEEHGFVEDKKDRWAGHTCMRSHAGEKIYVSQQSDGVWLYWDAKEDDGGSVIDFALRYGARDIREAVTMLQNWSGEPGGGCAGCAVVERPPPRSRSAIEELIKGMRPALRHPYLERERGIPDFVFRQKRFVGTILTDARGNVVFPHRDKEGFCGAELRNHNFKGFMKGGWKGVWRSNTEPGDGKLVIAESAIDGISYAVIHPEGHSRYISLSGRPSAMQVELLRAEIGDMRDGSEIVGAFDNDEPGRQFAGQVEQLCLGTGAGKVRFRAHYPENGEKDWNDALRASQRPESVRARSLKHASHK